MRPQRRARPWPAALLPAALLLLAPASPAAAEEPPQLSAGAACRTVDGGGRIYGTTEHSPGDAQRFAIVGVLAGEPPCVPGTLEVFVRPVKP